MLNPGLTVNGRQKRGFRGQFTALTPSSRKCRADRIKIMSLHFCEVSVKILRIATPVLARRGQDSSTRRDYN